MPVDSEMKRAACENGRLLTQMMSTSGAESPKATPLYRRVLYPFKERSRICATAVASGSTSLSIRVSRLIQCDGMRHHSASATPFLSGFEAWSQNPWTTGASIEDAKGESGFVTLELCAGGGGQALGLENAGINHVALVEIDTTSCETLRLNRPDWKVVEGDLKTFDASRFAGADIVSGGLPCPPFSVAGKQLGLNDDRNLFPAMIRIVDQVRPKSVDDRECTRHIGSRFQRLSRAYQPAVEKARLSARMVLDGCRSIWCSSTASEGRFCGAPQEIQRTLLMAERIDGLAENSWGSNL